MRALCTTLIAGVLIGSAQTPGRGRGGVQSISTRPADSHSITGAAAGLMGWRVGLPANAFGQMTFSEAAAKVDAAGIGFIEGSSGQKVSSEIAKNLDYNLSAEETAAVRRRLAELRLRMAAYDAGAVPADTAGRRKLFEFAKALGVETIVTAQDAAALPELDKLANEFGVNVAVDSVKGIDSFSKRIGVRARHPASRWPRSRTGCSWCTSRSAIRAACPASCSGWRNSTRPAHPHGRPKCSELRRTDGFR